MKTFFYFGLNPISVGNSNSADVKAFFLSLSVFRGKNSSSTNVKALLGQFGPTLSEKERLCKKRFKVSSGASKKPAVLCYRFATPGLDY